MENSIGAIRYVLLLLVRSNVALMTHYRDKAIVIDCTDLILLEPCLLLLQRGLFTLEPLLYELCFLNKSVLQVFKAAVLNLGSVLASEMLGVTQLGKERREVVLLKTNTELLLVSVWVDLVGIILMDI